MELSAAEPLTTEANQVGEAGLAMAQSTGLIGIMIVLVALGCGALALWALVESALRRDGRFPRSVIALVVAGFTALGLGVVGFASGAMRAYASMAIAGELGDSSVLASGISQSLASLLFGALVFVAAQGAGTVCTVIHAVLGGPSARRNENAD
ncbi:MAG: hypothetical protein PF961_22080 [Planctomycetota bacterium]|jgi:uncharacterized membrane protein YidH (DUF202 family)|nr:hypothetical protein [Planctomycetota bacterium]